MSAPLIGPIHKEMRNNMNLPCLVALAFLFGSCHCLPQAPLLPRLPSFLTLNDFRIVTEFSSTVTSTLMSVSSCFQVQVTGTTGNMNQIPACDSNGLPVFNPAPLPAAIRDAFVLERLQWGQQNPGHLVRFQQQQEQLQYAPPNRYQQDNPYNHLTHIGGRVGRSLVDEEPIETKEMIKPTKHSEMGDEEEDADELESAWGRKGRFVLNPIRILSINTTTMDATVTVMATASTTATVPIMLCTPPGETNFCQESMATVGLQQCVTAANCNNFLGFNACVAGNCVQCATDADCTGTRSICNPATRECVECLSNLNCIGLGPSSGGVKVCDPMNNNCVDCLANANCREADKPACDLAQTPPVCVACADAACPLGQTCNDDGECACTPGATPSQCPSNAPYCNAGKCQECGPGEDSRCVDPLPHCNLGTNRCVECEDNMHCTDAAESNTGSTQVCNKAINACVDCHSTSNCDGSVCETDPDNNNYGKCVECSNSACTFGLTCQDDGSGVTTCQ